jgi:DNA-binding NtrC family response regulator
MSYPWPGNIRELENLIARAILISSGPEITPDFLFPLKQTSDSTLIPLSQATKRALEAIERQKIIEALDIMKGNRSRAARLLGISRAAFYKKLRSYSIKTLAV